MERLHRHPKLELPTKVEKEASNKAGASQDKEHLANELKIESEQKKPERSKSELPQVQPPPLPTQIDLEKLRKKLEKSKSQSTEPLKPSPALSPASSLAPSPATSRAPSPKSSI